MVLDLVAPVLGRTPEDLEPLIEIPPDLNKGDRALPCFRFAKEEKCSPQELATRWKKAICSKRLPEEIERIEAAGGYLNFFITKRILTAEVLQGIYASQGKYGFEKRKKPPVAVIEFSSPNIAKPFSIGHLRSTNIGAALARIFEARGWRVIRMNHLGDWGTQFGKLMAAYRRWGNAEMLREDAILNLYKLYVRFHEEEVSDPTLIEEARDWFSRLESGDAEAKELWQWFRDLTLAELKPLYDRLSVEFDYLWGESFYIDKLPTVLKELETKGLLKESDDATVIDLEPHGLPTALVQKSDESSLYLTRDLAAAIIRFRQFAFDRMIYVVGSPQRLHFQQVFKVLELLGHEWVSRCEHVPFGHISFGDEGMSTRKGNVVFLADVLDRAEQMARKIVEEKNPNLEEKEAVAKDVALAAILFADLSAKRVKDVRFSWEEMLSFDGETGPYLQYTLVRTESLIRKYDRPIDGKANTDLLSTSEESALIRELSLFPVVLRRSEYEREPFLIGQQMISLARQFNRFYAAHRIVDAPEGTNHARMLLVSAVREVLITGLKLLGIPTLKRM